MTIRIGTTTRVTAAMLVVALAQPPAGAQSGAFCPVIPQTRIREPFLPSGGRFITLAAAMPESVRYRLRFAGPKDVVLVDAESLKADAARDALRASKAQVVIKTDRAPDAAVRLLSQRVSDIETIVAIPATGQGVEKMYGLTGDAQARALRHFETRVARPLGGVRNASVLSARTDAHTIASLIERKARAATLDKPLVIVAHNENGILLFPDGSKLEVARIQSLGAGGHRPVLVLSCETVAVDASSGLATTRRFGFDEIALALASATRRLDNLPDPQLGTLVQELNGALNASRARTGRTVRIAFAVVGAAAVIVAVALVLEDDDERRGAR